MIGTLSWVCSSLRGLCDWGGRYQSYRHRQVEIFRKHPELARKGDWKRGEIEVVIDPQEIGKIEKAVQERLLRNGFTQAQAKEWSRSGVIAEDSYFLLIRDAVLFPNGQNGMNPRYIWKRSLDGSHGAAALPVLPDGRILLNLNFRHATRTWEFELPRGMANPGERPCNTALRELEEETGRKCADPILLADSATDTGILTAVPSLYYCLITGDGKLNRENEAIKKCIPFTLEEVTKGLTDGYLVHEEERIPLRDSFLTGALMHAHLQGYIKLPSGLKREVVVMERGDRKENV